MKTAVSISSAQRDIAITPLRRLLTEVTRDVLAFENAPPTRVHIAFVTDATARSLHQEHFNDPSPTDCMTFPVDAPCDAALPDGFLGEVVICARTALVEALRRKYPPTQELILYLVHGLLHLIGYEDTTESKRARMKRQEKMHMRRLEKKGLLVHCCE